MKISELFFVSLLFITSLGFAQTEDTQKPSQEKIQALETTCASDVGKFCQSESSEHKGSIGCLKKNLEQLSSECKTLVSEIPEPPAGKRGGHKDNGKMDSVKQNCATDVESLCKSSESSQGGPIACLKKNLDQLSSACKISVSEIPEPPAQKSGAGKIMGL